MVGAVSCTERQREHVYDRRHPQNKNETFVASETAALGKMMFISQRHDQYHAIVILA